MYFIIIATIIASLVLFVLWLLVTPRKYIIEKSHVLITGGSSGIGKALAVEAFQRKANVTLVARNLAKLKDAVKEVQCSVSRPDQKVQAISCDISGDTKSVEEAIQQAESKFGPVDILINCAGISQAGRFEDVDISEFKKLMNVNYLGCVTTTKAVIRTMKDRGKGRVVFVSSQAGQLGIYGFTPYSPSKYALRGLAESLQMELAPYNIRVTVSFPPDTDTPGYKEEMTSGSKPEETVLISETSGLFKADAVAKKLIDDTLAGRFQSGMGLDGWMLCTLTAGMSPVTSVGELLAQVFLMGLFRAVSFFYLLSFDAIVNKCKKKRDTEEKKKSQ